MKILILHDADHLYGREYWENFIYPKKESDLCK